MGGDHTEDARIGTTIRGKYRIDRLLGHGGMAVVYAATHRNKKRFALKLLRPELSTNADMRARFVREGYVANTVDHPGAVAVLDDDVAEDGSAFIVMELLDGAPLDAIAERHGERLQLKTVLTAAFFLLDVLAAAHTKSIVHRDIKPANVFITKDGTLKVLDFGIARLRDPSLPNATSSGMMMGTPSFLPPEQAKGIAREIDARTDVWAVGATIFALLSGETVHRAETGAMMVIETATKPARSLAAAVKDAPEEMVAIVDKALAFEKDQRWASASEMRDALGDLHQKLYGGPPTKTTLAHMLDESAHNATLVATPGVITAPTPQTSRPGLTTAQPVSSDPTPTTARRRPWGFAIPAGALALAAVTAVVLFAKHKPDIKPLTIADNPQPPPPASATPASPIPNAEPTPTASATAAPSASVTTGATVAKSAVPIARPSAPHATTPKNCDPPYTIDAQGGKHFKTECL